MNRREFCLKHNVRVEYKRDLPLMRAAARLIGLVSPRMGKKFLAKYFTTYRKPFGKGIIGIPDCVDIDSPTLYEDWIDVFDHELIHVDQQRTAWGLLKSFLLYFFLPLPAWLSGRWFIERGPFSKVQIARGRRTPRSAALQLWNDYGRPWPLKWMIDYFERQRPF